MWMTVLIVSAAARIKKLTVIVIEIKFTSCSELSNVYNGPLVSLNNYTYATISISPYRSNYDNIMSGGSLHVTQVTLS